jgi:hypothetical protein
MAQFKSYRVKHAGGSTVSTHKTCISTPAVSFQDLPVSYFLSIGDITQDSGYG